jgi:hypothetical protein
MIGLAVAAVGAGCGGGSDAPTKAEFVKEGNAICQQAGKRKNSAILAYLKENQQSKPTQALEEKLVTDIALPPFQTMSEELRELGTPSGDEDDVEAIIAAFEGTIENVEANPVAALTSSDDLFSKANELAADYGLSACAEV